MTKKYEMLADDIITTENSMAHRIRALKDFGNVKAGDLGGYIQSESNLSHDGTCWVSDNARVYGDAKILSDAVVCDNAIVSGRVVVTGCATICEFANVSGEHEISGHTWIGGRPFINN